MSLLHPFASAQRHPTSSPPKPQPQPQPHSNGHAPGHAPRHAHGHAHAFHPLPVIGHPAAYYEKHIRLAEQAGDVHARASHKVGAYITAALDPNMPWDDKLRHFCHAQERYGKPPEDADDAIRGFYQKLGDLVRRYAGQEAVKLVRHEHERYLHRLKQGATREELADEADVFFPRFVGHSQDCPQWFTKDAWNQIRAIEAQWI